MSKHAFTYNDNYQKEWETVWISDGKETRSFRWRIEETPQRMLAYPTFYRILDPFRKGAPLGGYSDNKRISF